jgi:hypothetical protein
MTSILPTLYFQFAPTTIIGHVLLSQAMAPNATGGWLPNRAGLKAYEKAVSKHALVNRADLGTLR